MAVSPAVGRSRLTMTTPLAFLAFIVTVGISVFPVFTHQFISLNDVYNHVARAPVLAYYHKIPEFTKYWVPNWRLVPYAGFDLIAVGLLPWFSSGMIVKIMVSATIALMLAGVMLLSRAAHGRWSAFVLVTAPLLLNRTLLSGFINYLSGIGVCLMGAAAWIALRDRGPVVRMLVLGVFAVGLCAIHLFACGVLGIIVVAIELATVLEHQVTLQRLFAAVVMPAIAFIPAFLIVAFVAPHPGFHIVYGTVARHLAAFAVPLTYAPVEQAIGFVAVGIAVLAFWASGRVHVDRRLALAALLLALVQMVIPSELGTATVVDHRLPVAFWFVVVCAFNVRVEKTSTGVAFIVLVAAVFAMNVAIVQARWTKENVVYDEADHDMMALPGTARVATAYPATGLDKATRPDVALYYMPAFDFVPRGGFTQILWTIPDQHPLIMRPRYQQLTTEASPEALWRAFVTQTTPERVIDPRILDALKQYDYVVFLDAEPFKVDAGNLLAPVKIGQEIHIYRVLHEAAQNGGEQTDTNSGGSGADMATPRPRQ